MALPVSHKRSLHTIRSSDELKSLPSGTIIVHFRPVFDQAFDYTTKKALQRKPKLLGYQKVTSKFVGICKTSKKNKEATYCNMIPLKVEGCKVPQHLVYNRSYRIKFGEVSRKKISTLFNNYSMSSKLPKYREWKDVDTFNRKRAAGLAAWERKKRLSADCHGNAPVQRTAARGNRRAATQRGSNGVGTLEGSPRMVTSVQARDSRNTTQVGQAPVLQSEAVEGSPANSSPQQRAVSVQVVTKTKNICQERQILENRQPTAPPIVSHTQSIWWMIDADTASVEPGQDQRVSTSPCPKGNNRLGSNDPEEAEVWNIGSSTGGGERGARNRLNRTLQH